MPDECHDAASEPFLATEELRPERLGQTEELRPERLGQTAMDDSEKRRRYEESAGLRRTVLAYLPQDLGQALSTVVSYVYDQVVAEGNPPGEVGYVQREAAALVADLGYIQARLEELLRIGGQTTVSPGEVGILSRAEEGLPSLRRAISQMTRGVPEPP